MANMLYIRLELLVFYMRGGTPANSVSCQLEAIIIDY